MLHLRLIFCVNEEKNKPETKRLKDDGFKIKKLFRTIKLGENICQPFSVIQIENPERPYGQRKIKQDITMH